MKHLNWLDWTAFVLVIVGALNWLLIGLVGLNVVDIIFDFAPMLEGLVYTLVGLAGLWLIWFLVRDEPATG